MKTLADFKRAMQVGTKWHGYNHHLQRDFGVREVGKVQTNSFAFITTKDSNVYRSWTDFPKAKDIEFLEDGTVNIYTKWQDNPRYLLLSYKQVQS